MEVDPEESMLRTLIYLIGALLAITFVRGVIGILGRAFTQQASKPSDESSASRSSATTTAPPPKAVGGELKKCSVCGVYAPAHSHRGDASFCSAECEAKYQPA